MITIEVRAERCCYCNRHYWETKQSRMAALFTIARTWKQPICLVYKQMDKEGVVHIYNGILLSHKKE